MSNRLQWTNPPDHRGSLDILWTCLSTLGLCVWTAVHPNVQLDGCWRKSNLERIGMMVVAIVLPEVIICSAWEQLHTAKRIRKGISTFRYQRDLFNPEKPSLREASDREKATQKALDRNKSLQNELGDRSHTQDRRKYAIHIWIEALRLRCSRLLSAHNDTGAFQPSNKGPTNDCRPAPGKTDGRLGENDHSADGSLDGSLDVEKPVSWSMDQAFFVTMGGLIIDTPELGRQYLTAEGILILATVGLLPQLNERDVIDRNKADTLAKGLVIIQLTWFLLQVLVRVVNSLPITLLEAHTSIHVGFTILIFSLWFRKPYNVQYPITISDQDSVEMAHLFEFDARRRRLFSSKYRHYEREREEYWKHRATSTEGKRRSHGQHPPPVPPTIESLTESLKQYTAKFEKIFGIEDPECRTSTGRNSDIFATVEGANRAIRRLRQHGFTDEMLNARQWDLLSPSNGFCHIQNTWGRWSTSEGQEISVDKIMHMVFNILYGASHAAAWSSTSFPTVKEKWMWRCSTAMLCSVPIWGTLWILWWKAVSSTHKLLFPVRNGDLNLIVAPLFVNVICAYTFARAFFLIECLGDNTACRLTVIPQPIFDSLSFFTSHLPTKPRSSTSTSSSSLSTTTSTSFRLATSSFSSFLSFLSSAVAAPA